MVLRSATATRSHRVERTAHHRAFKLDDPVRTPLVIDRLAYWYYHPREWLKKAALVNGTYLLNSPFTFQSMEKHSAYCAMVRLGAARAGDHAGAVQAPVDNVRWAYTAERYNEPFDLDALAEELGYPLYMKPFDGGGWRGVSRIENREDLHRAYDASGEMLMHCRQRSTTTTSRGHCRSVPRRWSWTSVPISRCTVATRSRTTSSARRRATKPGRSAAS
jgi:hypothetical protein